MNEEAKLEFEKSLELRNLEINNFWKRGWFFGALIIAFFTLYLKIKQDMPFYSIYISFILFAASFAQAFINRGSKYWQERWEYKVKNRESKLNIDVTKTERYNNKEFSYLQDCIEAKDENKFVKATRYSVSKLTILVWDFIAIFFILLWLNDIVLLIQSHYFVDLKLPFFLKPLIFHLIYVTYFLKFIIRSKMKNSNKKSECKDLEEIKKRADAYLHDNVED